MEHKFFEQSEEVIAKELEGVSELQGDAAVTKDDPEKNDAAGDDENQGEKAAESAGLVQGK